MVQVLSTIITTLLVSAIAVGALFEWGDDGDTSIDRTADDGEAAVACALLHGMHV